jgi:Myb-like DNA-binding domain
LLRAIQTIMDSSGSSASTGVKWPEVARLVPGRTGKQCRERYFNHLAPTVVSAQWTPVEDATVCRLYRRVGTGWASISRLLPGRSDNNVKNRFHFLRRQLEKAATTAFDGKEADDSPDTLIRDCIHTALVANGTPNDDLSVLVGDILARMLRTGRRLLAPMDLYGSYFGPFETPRPSDGVVCMRCALFIPAAQTGSEVCSKTGWCSACSGTMVFLSDALLRLEHELQSSSNPIDEDDSRTLEIMHMFSG